MLIVFLVSVDETCAFQDMCNSTEAYHNYKDAKAQFDLLVRQAKETLPDDWEKDEREGMFEAYPEGCWSEDHYGVYLNKVEVK